MKVFSARESLVSDIPAGDRKIVSLFLQCTEASEVVVGLAVSVGGQYGFGYPLPQPLFQYRYEGRSSRKIQT